MSARRERACIDEALDDFLAAVDARMNHEIAATPAAMPAAALLAAGGKRLRARLLWLSAAAAAAPTPIAAGHEQLLRAATAIELAHLASLVHDDIVDGAKMRRGIPAVHWRWGISVGVRTGTALLHLAGAVIAPLPTPARRTLAHAALAMCRGQVRELMQSFQLCSQRQRLAIMSQKTAALFEAVAHLGVTLAGGPPSCDSALRRFARRFGIAFQIADDVMDLVGDPARLGRANGADLHDGVMTLPVLLAAEASPAIRRVLGRLRTDGDSRDTAACIRLIAGTGAIAAAAAESHRWLARACAALSLVPLSPARRELISLAEAAVTAPIGQPDTLLLDAGTRQGTTPLRFDYSGTTACGADRTLPDPHRHRRPSAAADALILRHLARIEPTLPKAVQPLITDAGAMQLAARLRRAAKLEPVELQPAESQPGKWRAASRAPATLGSRALALACCAVSEVRVTRSPVQAIAISDCLQAIALACFADADSAAQAASEAFMLEHLSKGLPETALCLRYKDRRPDHASVVTRVQPAAAGMR